MKHLRVLLVCLGAVVALGTGGADAKTGKGGRSGGPKSWSAPIVSFSVDRTSYAPGDTARLSWASMNTRGCEASGDWSGKLDAEGSYRTPPLDASATFVLTCYGQGKTSAAESLSVEVLRSESADSSEPEPESGREPEVAPEPEPVSPPEVILDAADARVDSGTGTTLSWSSAGADACTASGDWSGTRPPSGAEAVGPLRADARFELSCTGAGGSATATAVVNVDPVAPNLSFSSTERRVNSGGYATLSWSSSHTDGCSASGGWSGNRPVSGSETVGPLQQGTTFSLACSGAGGNVLEMLTVTVVSPVNVSWIGPTENVDGSPLNDLASYNLYVGLRSGEYGDASVHLDAGATSHELDLETGTYYLAMTAVNADGNESGLSNEIERTAP